MGLPIANALTTRGPVVAYDAAPAVRIACGRGGHPGCSSRSIELARSCNTVLLSLPSAAAVEDVVAEIAAAAPGLLILDTSTIGPEDSRRIGALALADGSTYLDTPILGRPEMVGSWTMPVGGPACGVRRGGARTRADRAAGRARRRARFRGHPQGRQQPDLQRDQRRDRRSTAARPGGRLDPGVFVDTVVDSGAATVSGLFRSIAPRAVDGNFRRRSPSSWSARTTTSPSSSPPA